MQASYLPRTAFYDPTANQSAETPAGTSEIAVTRGLLTHLVFPRQVKGEDVSVHRSRRGAGRERRKDAARAANRWVGETSDTNSGRFLRLCCAGEG